VVEDVLDLAPGEGEVLAAVEAAAVNYPDVPIIANRCQICLPVPFTPGSQYAG